MKPWLALVLACVAIGCNCGRPPVSVCPQEPEEVANEGWAHRQVGLTIQYAHNPPASGPHYPVWAKFGAYTTPLPRPYWVHNLEHGTVLFLYRPDAPAELIAKQLEIFQRLPNDALCGHPRAILTPDPELETQFAVVAANFVLAADCVEEAPILAFVEAHRGHGPEAVCVDGSYP